MTRLLLDTSAYSAFMRGHSEIVDQIAYATELHLTPIILGELLAGFRRGKHQAKNERELEQFLASPRVVIDVLDDETAQRYATILEALRKAGTPIPTNDLWIAASAMQHGLILLTTDTHYQHVHHILVRHYPFSGH